MQLRRFQAQGFRNLAPTQLALPPGVSLVHGANGSGKTSLLEAIYALATGRSFRSNRLASVVNYDQDTLTLFGEVGYASGRVSRLGVTRGSQGSAVLKLDGERVGSNRQLAEALPLLLIHPESMNLIMGSPEQRRRFIDWGVFHVEQGYGEASAVFRRVLEHRNAALRQGTRDLASWNAQFLQAAGRVHESRMAYLASLAPLLESALNRLGGVDKVTLRYQPGWDRRKSLAEALDAQAELDRQSGFTRSGPQRAELRLEVDGRKAAECLSRGQQKVLACALLLAQNERLRVAQGLGALVLVDDLAAELDLTHRQRLATALLDQGGQVLMTAVEPSLVLEGLARAEEVTVFHVEQGQITPA
jgi:DNA replication and repair protein RecF